MASITLNVAALVRKNLLKGTTMTNESKRYNVCKKLVSGNEVSTTQLYEQTALLSGLGLPTVVNEYGALPTTQLTVPYTKTHTPLKRALQVRFSGEVQRKDQYGKIRGTGKSLSHVFYVMEEIDAAKYLNAATNSALLSTPAGQPYWSTAHPLESGTDSNRFTTALALGASALEQAVQNLQGLKAHKGYVNPIAGPFCLEVASGNAMMAKRLLGSEYRPQSADNDINPIAGQVTEYISGPWFTNSGYWSIHSMSDMENRRIKITGEGFTVTGAEYDQDDDSWKMSARTEFIYDILDYRDVWGSPAS